MAKKKKLWRWLSLAIQHKNIALAFFLIFIALLYFPWHAYRTYADTKKIKAARSAVDTVYRDISKSLGRPDNFQSVNTCGQGTCLISTSFVYGVTGRAQALLLRKDVQAVIAKHKNLFHSRGKPAADFTDHTIVLTVFHEAQDNYSGPYRIPCSIKYVFDTPDDTDLSINDPAKQALEATFSCSDKSAAIVYPSIQSL